MSGIYVLDDKLAFTYNFHDGTETITLKEIEAAFGSDLSQVAPPPNNPNLDTRLGLLLFVRKAAILGASDYLPV